MQVAICIITYQRPEGAKRLLQGLNQLTFKEISIPDICIILIENDKSALAYQSYQTLKPSFKWNLKYDIEPQRGISYARNRAVSAVSPESEFIVFIDDDEVPHPSWLEELLISQSTYKADIVQGRVIPWFEDSVPKWVKKGGFFDSPPHNSGDFLEAAYTNNLLVRTSLLKRLNIVFDERFALTGGEDSYLFRTLHSQGCSIVWADSAVVYETIPASRTTWKWILLRGYRGCLSYTLWKKESDSSIKTSIVSFVKGTIQIAVGLISIFPSLFLGTHVLVKSLLIIYKGAGCLSGLFGIKYQEYKTVHGS